MQSTNMSEIIEIKDIPESQFPMSEEQEMIVRSMGNLRLAIDAKYPEISEAKLNRAVLLSHPSSAEQYIYVKLGDDFTEAWLAHSKDDPIGSGALLGRVSFAYRPDDNPYINHGAKVSPRESEAIINDTVNHARRTGVL